MDRKDLLPARMNALWFTYISIFLFALLPNWEIYLSFFEIMAYSGLATILVNLWSIYNEKTIMDERKQSMATEGMAWAFVVVSLLLVSAGTTGVELDTDLIRGTAEMGLWTWLMVFSVKNLYHRYGDGLL